MIFSKFISKQLHIVDLLPWISYQGSKIVDVDLIINKIITNNDEFISIITESVNAEKTVCYAPLQCLQNSMNRTRSSIPTQLTQLLQEDQSNDQLETEYPVNNKNRYPNSNGKGKNER
ncbi:PREDICTED: uncharacterized protein LOC105368713 [Ceratosolen solmsi marchali]|uniref:Uncharacterized protein LOC105368713 n=1 Tax=Ceratosolen solmsi marchali TaxID=326594 RepID=A0AAJ7E347_9HYME|nr:PREDICTED: uncharacterized protein LOC105368713 [Ceratosolen solmsi marchali]